MSILTIEVAVNGHSVIGELDGAKSIATTDNALGLVKELP